MCRATKMLALCVLLSSCDCGGSISIVDASTDGNLWFADAATDAALPGVIRETPPCSELAPGPNQVCVERGWFEMSRFNNVRFVLGSTLDKEFGITIGNAPVYLESYYIDENEVTLGDYQSYASEKNIALPPDDCGGFSDLYTYERYPEQPDIERGRINEKAETRSDHPMVCVTRGEAQSYCEAKGGRLPRVAEWLKAGQAPYPEFREYPWGNDLPLVSDTSAAIDYEVFFRDYATHGQSIGGELKSVPVGSRPLGKSHWGVNDLSGNVSEFLSDCEEELESHYGVDAQEGMPLVRPNSAYKSSCSKAILVGGGNWRSRPDEVAIAQGIWQMRDGKQDPWSEMDVSFTGFYGIGVFERFKVVAEYAFGQTIPLSGDPNQGGPGNERRSWRIGFRCVYDVNN